ncbi:hypothetical protein GPY61_30250 [Massilia sp. NEAU-DD11]|uniref:Methyl-accepting chemotaxis protein n=1 Tax=Massilia cellulosiltytica TaxID=2683234 RepID=A0A7X3KAN2_9BURK|nr:hypothetical protein [Telluria cellulosilytica]MVW64218.1 hypothetical protein [Telluria cellulosilytica]
MNPNEILGFLLPQFTDALQLTFFLVILGMIVATIVSAHRTATPKSWEHKWNRGTPDDPTDDLEIGHGSVTDLWQAVATAPEKLAEIMPGMLLVVGLLGTFLGLGLALNHASSILGHANLADPGAAADSMQNLLGLLQGLGTKFKTSTWGILGFVLLKIWSEITRFDEKRMAWVIGKVKGELELRKRTEAQDQEARQQALFKQIGGTAQHIVAGFGQQIAALIKSNESLSLQQLAQLAKIEQGTEGVRIELGNVQAKIEQGTDGVRTELGHVQTRIEQGTDRIREELGQMRTETQSMRTAMSTFTDSTQRVVENMGAAAEGMAAGADRIGSGATELVQAVDAFETQFTEVLNNVRQDLSAAINNLSAQASATLEKGSSQLNEATTKISTALEALSEDVKTTMNSVDVSINKALMIQERAAEKFIESSDTLNENIAATTGIVEKLAKPIEFGLQAVSGSSLKIGKMTTAVEASTQSLTKVVEQLQGLPDALAPLNSMTEEHTALLSMLKPLSETVKVQQAMLKLLEEIQRDRAPARSVTVATDQGAVSDTTTV